jgi:hypothetical protein
VLPAPQFAPGHPASAGKKNPPSRPIPDIS